MTLGECQYLFREESVVGRRKGDRMGRPEREILSEKEKICSDGKIFEDILKAVFDKYSLMMNATQYLLVGDTLKAYLTYLKNEKKIDFFFEENRMLWKKCEN